MRLRNEEGGVADNGNETDGFGGETPSSSSSGQETMHKENDPNTNNEDETGNVGDMGYNDCGEADDVGADGDDGNGGE